MQQDQPEAMRRRILGGLLLLVFSALLLVPNAVSWLYLVEEPGNYAWQRLSYATALWICLLAVMGNVRWTCLLILPALFLVPLECYLLVRYHAPLQPHAMGILLESDLSEIAEHMRGLWTVAIFGYSAVALIAYACLRGLWWADLRWRHRSRYWFLAALLTTGCGFYAKYEAQESRYGLQAWPDEFNLTSSSFLVDRLRETSPFGIPLRLSAYLESHRQQTQARARLKDWRFGARQVPAAKSPQTIVLVLGESGRADRWRINGYSRATSPKLDSTPNLINLRDMASAATTTRLSIPAMLTRKSTRALAYDLAFGEGSLISAFQEAGFRTYWYSNQMSSGFLDSPITVYAREAAVLKFLNFSSYTYRTPYDEVLLPELERSLREGAPRKLVVLHTLGSHFNYGYRYPPDFERFRPAMGDATGGSLHDSGASESLNNAYDNSILYTDHVLGEVIRMLASSASSNAAMLYVADHGENLFDQGCPFAGHAMATRENIQVAAFFWYSRGFAETFPEKIANLKSNKDKKLSGGDIFYTMLDLVDIRLPGEDLSRSLVSAQFMEKPRLVAGLNSILDYDRATKRANCQLAN